MANVSVLDDLQDVSAESGVVCSIINNPELYNLSDFLQASHFANRELGAIYYVCGELIQSGVYKLDAFNISVQAKNNKGIDKLLGEYGGDKLIKEITDNAGIVARKSNEEYLLVAKKVSELGFRRELYKKLRGYETEVLDLGKSLGELNSGIITGLDNLAEKYVSNSVEPMFNEKIDGILQALDERRKKYASGTYGLPWKLDIFNKMLPPLLDSELILLLGRMKSKKSVILLNEAIHKASMGVPTLMTSSEMSDEKDLLRGMAIVSGIPVDDLKTGNIGDHNYQKYKDAIHFFKHAPFHRVYDTSWTSEKLIMQVKKTKHQLGCQFLVHDYVKITNIHGPAEKSNALGEMADILKNDIAGGFSIPVLSAVQLNRNDMIADSDSVARYASMGLKIYNKNREDIQEDGVECGNMRISVPFSRDGHNLQDEEDWMDIYIDGSPNTNLRLYEAKKQHEEVAPDFLQE